MTMALVSDQIIFRIPVIYLFIGNISKNPGKVPEGTCGFTLLWESWEVWLTNIHRIS